eukprot:TRINITY_DN42689_c0_g1_i1.p1 TRINITY_DN42689_c0_g1~~TRINITY_DN42689_c0_g1_i1.p1  ORF type:complete len:181 (+),score=28.52 TRINITY_DN42689_c0_g1_i1:49-591(+)
MTQTMKLNVGGEVFEVAQATLKTSHDNFFSALLSRWSPDSSNPHFIDRDPQLFRYILAWLRDRKVVLPIGVSKQAVLKEAEYFSLPIDAEDVIIDYSQIADIRKRLCDADQQLATDHTALSNRMLVEATAHEIVLYAGRSFYVLIMLLSFCWNDPLSPDAVCAAKSCLSVCVHVNPSIGP